LGTANFTRSSKKPLLSLVEPEPPLDASRPAGPEGPFDEPEDSDDGADGGDPAAAYVEDTNGDLLALNLETGELADSPV
jgi:single-strand DNA-binding protein